MTAELTLHKLHGLGNDFLVAFVDELPDDACAAAAAVSLCHRQRGVGADGLMYAVLDPGSGDTAPAATMRLWNSDGSVAEVSGNGLRCLAHAVARTLGRRELDMVVHTVVGPRRCSIRPTEAPETVVGTAELGRPGAGPEPDADPAAAANKVLGPGSVQRWTTAQVGNPHVVVAVADPSSVPLRAAGPAVEELFSGGINIHFGAVSGPDELTLAVWERGAGATEACGTGAVAAAAAFHQWGAVSENVKVRMPGGDAHVDLTEPVTLTGESTYVATITVGNA